MGKIISKSALVAMTGLFFILDGSIQAQTSPGNTSQEALSKTMELLLNPTQRADAIANDPKAQEADARARALMGNGKNYESIYQLTSEIFSELVKSNQGDPGLMIQKLEKGKSDPESFLRSLPKDLQEKVRALAAQISGQSPSSGRPRP